MTITIDLGPEEESKLLERAAQSGQDVTAYVACVVMFFFIAGGTLALATGFGAAGSAAAASAESVTDDASSNSQEASPAPVNVAGPAAPPAQKPATVPDPDDPQLAGRYTGRVLDPDGKPLSGARLFIAPDNPAVNEAGPVRAMSDAGGRFEFDAPDMTYTELDGLPARRQGLLIAAFNGYAPDWFVTWGQNRGSFRSHWDPVKGADLTLQLARDDVPIHGLFLDPEGQPVAGARVRLLGLKVPWKHDLDAHLKKYSLSKDNKMGMFDYERSLSRPAVLPGIQLETITGADGRFRISGLGRDRLADLIVTAPNVVDTDLTVMTRDAPDVVLDRDSDGNPTRATLGAGFTLKLKRGRTITGLVRDRASHEPIPGTRIGYRGGRSNGKYLGDTPWTTDANGRFTITGVDPSRPPPTVTAIPQPGRPYLMPLTRVDANWEAVIECTRGIVFRLKVIDEEGRPVEAEVTYTDVQPNPHFTPGLGDGDNGGWPYSRAARTADGTYEGFVLPGPGAVLVKTPRHSEYRPAHVDPKAFFAPGKTNWTAQERISAYGTHDTLQVSAGWLDLHDYAAIVLVNPPVNSGPLELTASVARDKPRRVSIIDPDGKPVVGVQTDGLTFHPWDAEPRLRAASFLLTKLHPDRFRRITFVKEDRKLVGFLLAKGDGDAPYTVRMQPWATVTGRLVTANGQALSADGIAGVWGGKPAVLSSGGTSLVTNSDPEAGEYPEVTTDADGRFRLEKLVPGQRYSAQVYRGFGLFAGMAFENLVLHPGEVRDLGDIRTKPPVNVRGK